MKIAIANDLRLACELLNNLIRKRTKHKVIWTACDGEDAIQKCLQTRPDILLMDLVMPKMNGAKATREIMKKCPCAILLVTASIKKNVSLVFEAMGCGALDVVKTPSFDITTHESENDDLLHKINAIGHLIENIEYNVSLADIPMLSSKETPPPMLVIGASTGGPTAIRSILANFNNDASFSTVIIQHIDPEFAPAFVSWLQLKTSLNVKLIEDNMPLKPGVVYVAGKNAHLMLNSKLELTYLPENHLSFLPNKPSIDIFFESLSKTKGIKGVACLLTGMGSDGAKGLLALRNCGFVTIAEDISTSIVYGMPKAALNLKAAMHILPVDLIGKKILELMNDSIFEQKL